MPKCFICNKELQFGAGYPVPGGLGGKNQLCCNAKELADYTNAMLKSGLDDGAVSIVTDDVPNDNNTSNATFVTISKDDNYIGVKNQVASIIHVDVSKLPSSVFDAEYKQWVKIVAPEVVLSYFNSYNTDLEITLSDIVMDNPGLKPRLRYLSAVVMDQLPCYNENVKNAEKVSLTGTNKVPTLFTFKENRTQYDEKAYGGVKKINEEDCEWILKFF